jgi:hypothetical protein
LILSPGIRDKRVKVGSSIRLIRPDRSIIETKIKGIPFKVDDILVGSNIKKDDVPIGTEVWLND